jgi:L-threonylcarbamoyladenylate synthase
MVDDVVAALDAGGLVVIPTDTVYGLACRPDREDAVRQLSALKGRPSSQPIALVAASVDALLELVPELHGRAETAARALLPGPYTLVLPNPARRFPWLVGDRPETIGVRVPDAFVAIGVVAATSANRHREPDPRRLDEVPRAILDAAAATLDGGALPGMPSTVVDLTGAEPVVLREGAVPAAEALARVASAVGK